MLTLKHLNKLNIKFLKILNYITSSLNRVGPSVRNTDIVDPGKEFIQIVIATMSLAPW